MGVVKVPVSMQPLEAVFVPEPVQSKPEPLPVVKPEIENVVPPVEEPMPQLDIEEPVAPPSDVPTAPTASTPSAHGRR